MDKYSIPNLVKACSILKVLSSRPEGITANELEALVQVPRTTGFRILKTLSAEGLAEKRGKYYFSGNDLVQIGLNSLRSLEIRSLAIPFLSDLATQTNYTAHLAVPSGRQSLILEVHDSPHPIRVASRSGTSVPLYCSSTGKVFLAYLFEQELEDYFSSVTLQKHTESTIVTLKDMQCELQKIKTGGYAVDDHEFHKDIWCLAAPVQDNTGKVIAAIGVTGPAAQSDDQKRASICTNVKKVAAELSAVLGYQE